MSSGDQFRHWVANAGTSQLFSAAAAVALVAAGVTASVLVAPGRGVGANGGPVRTGESVSGGNASTAGGGADALTAGATNSAGGSQPQSGSGRGTTSGPFSAVGATNSSSNTGATNVTKMASDRGITPSTVTIGFLTPNGSLASNGFSFSSRTDQDRYAQALVDYANRRGGAAGRKIVGAIRPTDPTSTSDQDAACQSMLNDQKVFGVVDLALSNGPAQACVAQSGATPYVHLVPWSRDFQALAHGYDVGYPAAIDRIALTIVRDLTSSGWMNKDSVVGLLGDNCPTTKPTVDRVLVPALERVVKHVEVGLHDCTIDAVVSQPPNIATRFRAAGVDHVITVANYVSTQIFVQIAANFGTWRPKYSASDWFAGVSDGTSRSYNPDQFDGAVGITTARAPLRNAGQPVYPGVERCDAAATEAGLAPVHGSDGDVDVVVCDQFFLMVDGINAAGPNPTRPGWAAAIQSLGEHDSVSWGAASFRPGKTNGSDDVYTAIWHRDCKCWKAASSMRPMAA